MIHPTDIVLGGTAAEPTLKLRRTTMGKGIRVSEKHGVNPSLGVCFWCGEDTGTIGLMGRIKDDAEAPRHAVFDYDPCDDCGKKWATGIGLFEVIPVGESDYPPVHNDGAHSFTGRYVIVSEDLINRMFNKPTAESVLIHRKAYVPPEVLDMLLHKMTEAGLIPDETQGEPARSDSP